MPGQTSCPAAIKEARWRLPKAVIAVFTAVADPPSVRVCMQAGADLVLEKPSDLQVLRSLKDRVHQADLTEGELSSK